MRLAAIILTALLTFAAAPPAAQALDCPTPYLCFLNGSWAADGTAFGKPARITMRWEGVLGGKFARIDYRIEPKENGEAFEGTGFYRPLKSAPMTAHGSTAKAQCIRCRRRSPVRSSPPIGA